MLTRKISIAIAAGLMLAGPALADEQDPTKTQEQTQPAKAPEHASAGMGDQVKDLAKAQEKGDATMGIGDQVREMARFHGCDVNGSAECKAHHAVHDALAEQAGAPADRPSLPGEPSGTAAAEHHAARTRTMEAERAAQRHAGRTAAAEQGGETQAMHRGGAGGHGMGGAMGGGMGEGMQAAETTRSGDMRHGAMGGTGGTTGPGGMMK